MNEIDANDSTPTSENVTDPFPLDKTVEDENENVSTDLTSDSVKSEATTDEWFDILDNGELRMKVLRKGVADTRPSPTDVCTINLLGKLDNGKVVEIYKSIDIQLGVHEVVQGLELALPLMNVGEETVVVIAPRFAYGSIGNPPDIPPDATITYTVELLKVDLEPNIETIPYENRKNLACLKRKKGNWWYLRKDAIKAIECYRKALEILDENIPYVDTKGDSEECTEEIIKNLIQEKLLVYNNLAAAQLFTKAYDTALFSVNEVIKHEPNNVKALFRKGKILSAKRCTNEAVDILRHALVLDPDNNAVKTELSQCIKLQQVEKEYEKNLYKKMLGQSIKDQKSATGLKGRNITWKKILGTAATATLMAAIAVAISYKFKSCSFI